MYPAKPLSLYKPAKRREIKVRLRGATTDPSKNLLDEMQNTILLEVDSVHGKSVHFPGGKPTCQALYEMSKTLCLCGRTKELWEAFAQRREKYIVEQIALVNKSRDQAHPQPHHFLQHMNEAWTLLVKQAKQFEKVLSYLDRCLATTRKTLGNWDPGPRGSVALTHELILQQFRKNSEVLNFTLMGVNVLLERCRSLEQQATPSEVELVRQLIQMFIKLRIYQKTFANVHLRALRDFYSAEATKAVREMEPTAYLRHIESRTRAEVELTLNLLEKRTVKPVEAVIDDAMLKSWLPSVLEKGFRTEVDASNLENIALMYRLTKKVDMLHCLRDVFRRYICDFGGRIVGSDGEDEKVNEDMIPRLIRFNDGLQLLMEKSFQSDPTFHEESRKACEWFVNRRRKAPTLLLAQYLDEHLGDNAVPDSTPDEEVTKRLLKAMQILKHVNDEGSFQILYRKNLASRLLSGRVKRTECEKKMIARIRKTCGEATSMVLEGMMKDIDVSNDLRAAYDKELSELAAAGVPRPGLFRAFVLQPAQWPLDKDMNKNVVIPHELQVLAKSFTRFYLKTFKGRKLAWNIARSSAIVEANFGSRTFEFEVSAYQALSLVLFSDSPVLTFGAIQEKTNIPDASLRLALFPLVIDHKILLKNPPGPVFNDSDQLSINKNFRSEKFRVVIKEAIEVEETSEEDPAQLIELQNHQIDASLVRIMKTNKQMLEKNLLIETSRRMRFDTSVQRLTGRIKRLIDRGYFHRDEGDKECLHYS